MRKARFFYSVEVEIDEDNPEWEYSDLSLYAIAQSLEMKPKRPNTVEAVAVKVTAQRNLVCHYLEESSE